jgi:N-acetylated-alpha-linked acidic dipeptidase
MRSLSGLLALSILALRFAGDQPPLRGYTAERSSRERVWEARFRSIPAPDSLRSYLRHLAARPHHLGSPYDRANAEWLLARFREFGFEARIDTFEVLFPTPRERQVEMLAPIRYAAKLTEPALPVDSTTAQRKEQLPGFNVYSIDGDVTGPLVYVNYGLPRDYEELERRGISVNGAIVLARYGGAWRGIKPKVAAEHGAIGCIIYSDPRDDGFFQGDVYPEGAYRPWEGVQRGSVQDMTNHPGDPFTPFRPARPGAPRLPLDSAATLTRIPVLPISAGDAEPLLRTLGGRVAPEGWRGALPFTYHIGPGPARVRLRVKFDWRPTPLYDVVATLKGADLPDQWILRGNHSDAWVNGAEDPLSSLVVLLEEARALGQLRRAGWTPRRTIVYSAWDGEEPGLLGSTEFVEAYADELQARAVVYINTDGNSRGYLGMGGSHGLEQLVNDVAREIQDPETGLSVWQRLRHKRLAEAQSAEERERLRSRPDLALGALGSGSDYTPFLQHLGIASLDLGFGGEDPGSEGVYHSIYDSYAWYTRFADTAFIYGRALAQVNGSLVLRLADADVLPWYFSGLADAVDGYRKEVEKLTDTRRAEIAERNRELDEGVFPAISDPRAPLEPPPRQEPAPFLNFAPLDNASTRLTTSAARYEAALQRVAAGDGAALADTALRAVNAAVIASERRLTRPGGLPGRPWYVHDLYAPGSYTGYGVKTLPAAREAIEAGRWTEAEQQIARVAETLDREADLIDSAAAVLEGVGSR